DELEEKKMELSQRLQEFKINGEIAEYTPGPVITTFEFVPDVGVKVKDVSSLTEDLALVVKAQYVRIERILGKKAIGIEIPNKKRETIHLRELLETAQYQHSSSPLTLALGKTASGDIFISDLKEMPHLLIAGATGSGKSVAIHSLILSILYKSSPQTVKFIMIDPKRIELAIYNSLPHLLTPVVVNPKLAKNALDWAVFEMENRYKKLATLQVRNIEQYNKKLEMLIQSEDEDLEQLDDKEPIPYIVIIIDELADLMMVSAREIEDNILRLAQKARAIGIHLILATQRPSIDVITGSIKNNFPSRIALAVPSKYDSRTIIDQIGAEKLLGNGDMLFLPPKTASLIRLHSAFVSESETVRVVNFLSKQAKPEFNTQIIKHSVKKEEAGEDQIMDELFFDAAETIISTGQASASYLQRKMSVGYARAGRLIDQLQEKGVISPPNSRNQREILMTMDELQNANKE
ncbi:MAG: type IV secretion system DNA-binding domain-containing protein, partial [Candidatus Aminicenantes bacterium]|nr:type IV secretion system DNA-binding domain-containing protein [Candidatus Aminicenantes bacterium]